MKYDQPNYLERFRWFLMIVALLRIAGSRMFTARLVQSKPVGHYEVDETLNYAAWYFLDTLQDDLRTNFQR